MANTFRVNDYDIDSIKIKKIRLIHDPHTGFDWHILRMSEDILCSVGKFEMTTKDGEIREVHFKSLPGHPDIIESLEGEDIDVIASRELGFNMQVMNFIEKVNTLLHTWYEAGISLAENVVVDYRDDNDTYVTGTFTFKSPNEDRTYTMKYRADLIRWTIEMWEPRPAGPNAEDFDADNSLPYWIDASIKDHPKNIVAKRNEFKTNLLFQIKDKISEQDKFPVEDIIPSTIRITEARLCRDEDGELYSEGNVSFITHDEKSQRDIKHDARFGSIHGQPADSYSLIVDNKNILCGEYAMIIEEALDKVLYDWFKRHLTKPSNIEAYYNETEDEVRGSFTFCGHYDDAEMKFIAFRDGDVMAWQKGMSPTSRNIPVWLQARIENIDTDKTLSEQLFGNIVKELFPEK